MPKFEYVAQSFNKTDKAYVLTRDQLAADSQDAAIRDLQQRGFTVLEIKPLAAAPLAVRLAGAAVSRRDLIFFFQQTAMLLKGGLSLLRALRMLGKDARSPGLAAALERIHADVEAGSALHAAMAKHPAAFDKSMIALVEAGEASGTLVATLQQLASHLTAQERIRKKIIGTMAYPAVVTAVAIAAMIFFSVYIIPTFANVFASLRLELPLLTRGVMGISRVLIDYKWLLVALAVGGVLGGRWYLSTAAGAMTRARLARAAPLFSGMLEDARLERFFATAALLLKSGVSLANSLQLLQGIFERDPIFSAAIGAVAAETMRGRDFVEALEAHGGIPPMALDSIRVGMESGNLPSSLENLAAYHRERIEVFTDNLSTVLEPIIVLSIGALVGVLLFSLFLPVMKLATFKPV